MNGSNFFWIVHVKNDALYINTRLNYIVFFSFMKQPVLKPYLKYICEINLTFSYLSAVDIPNK